VFLFVCFAALYQASLLVRLVSVMPIYNPIDEMYHYDYALKISEGIPRSSMLMHPMILLSNRQYGFPSVYYFLYPSFKEKDFHPDANHFKVNDQMYQHPPLYYKLTSFFISPKLSPLTQIINVHSLRLVGVIIFLLGGLLWAAGLSRLLGKDRMNFLLLLMLWSWTPADLFRYSNDMGVYLFSGVTVYAYSLTRREEGNKNLWLSLLLGICLAACAWTKYNLIYLFIPCICAGRLWDHIHVAYHAHEKNLGSPLWKKTIQSSLLDPALGICILSLLGLRIFEKMQLNRLVSGETPAWVSYFLGHSHRLLFGAVIWLGRVVAFNIPLSVTKFFLCLFLLGAFCALVVRERDDQSGKMSPYYRKSVLFFLFAVVWMSLIQGIISFCLPWFCQGRYLIPLLPFMIALMMEGFSRLGNRYLDFSPKSLAVIVAVLWISIHSYQLHYVILSMSV